MLPEKNSFGDFDLYIIQQGPRAWEDLRRWRSAGVKDAARRLLSPGDILLVERMALPATWNPLGEVPQLSEVTNGEEILT